MTTDAEATDWDDASEVRPRPTLPELTLDGATLEALEALARSTRGREARGRGVALRVALGAAGDSLRGIIDAIVQRVEELECAQRLASRDELTGLANRRSLGDGLERELARARRAGDPLSVLLFDIDGLKQINDTHGHAAGDEALREAALRAQETVRDGDLVARLGGDEFIVLLPAADQAETIAIGERMRDTLARHGIGVSFGVATTGIQRLTGSDLIKVADRELYRDKNARNSMRPSAPAPATGHPSRKLR